MYSLDGTEIYSVGTTYTPGAYTGSLSIDASTEEVFVTGFLNETTPGVVMRFDLTTGDPMPSGGEDGALFFQDESLVRPVGILVQHSTEDMENDMGADNNAPSSALARCGLILSLALSIVFCVGL